MTSVVVPEVDQQTCDELAPRCDFVTVADEERCINRAGYVVIVRCVVIDVVSAATLTCAECLSKLAQERAGCECHDRPVRVVSVEAL